MFGELLMKSRALVLVVLAYSCSTQAQGSSTGGTITIDSMEQAPAVVFEGQAFEIHLAGYNINVFSGLSYLGPDENLTVSVEDDVIDLRLEIPSPCFSPQPPLPGNDKPHLKVLPVSGLPAGTYTLRFFLENNCSIYPPVERQVIIYSDSDPLVFNQESPSENQIVSGVGVIRGWSCYDKTDSNGGMAEGTVIGNVSYQIDEEELISLPYGSPRLDTNEVCGENNTFTGYGAVTYWGSYEEGRHTFTLYIDKEPVESFSFRVVAPEEGFQKGLKAEYILEDFPGTGENVKVKWSEADQNFIIVDFD